MVASLAFSVISERRLVLEVVEQQTKDAADSYFDSINTMMLTGTMAQRDVLREKNPRATGCGGCPHCAQRGDHFGVRARV